MLRYLVFDILVIINFKEENVFFNVLECLFFFWILYLIEMKVLYCVLGVVDEVFEVILFFW